TQPGEPIVPMIAISASADDGDRPCPSAQEGIGSRRYDVTVGARRGAALILQGGNEHRLGIALDPTAKILTDQGKSFGDGSASAVRANHGYLDRVVQRASLPAIRERKGRGTATVPRSGRFEPALRSTL